MQRLAGGVAEVGVEAREVKWVKGSNGDLGKSWGHKVQRDDCSS